MFPYCDGILNFGSGQKKGKRKRGIISGIFWISLKKCNAYINNNNDKNITKNTHYKY